MSQISRAQKSEAAGKFYPLLLCLFVGSGMAALIYEIVWFQLLEFVIGSTAASLAVLLGTFMGGMCLGSLAFARIIPVSYHPLRVYAAIELSIGISGILILYFLPPAADLYSSIAGHGYGGILFRALLCALFLLAPTVLMGATLPCAARWIDKTPQGLSWLGILYTGNLAGAVFGCLLAGFYLLRTHDMATATFVAASVNALCATVAIVAGTLAQPPVPAEPVAPDVRTAIGSHGRLRNNCDVGTDCSRGASCLDPAAVAAAGTIGLYVLDHSGSVSGRTRPWEQRGIADCTRPEIHSSCWAGANFSWLLPLPGRHSASTPGCRAGRLIPGSASIHG